MSRIAYLLILALMAGACSVKQPAPVDEAAREALPETTEIPLDFQAAVDVAMGDVQDGWLASLSVVTLRSGNMMRDMMMPAS